MLGLFLPLWMVMKMKINNVSELEEKGTKFYSCGSQRLSHNIQTKLGMVPVNVYKHRRTGKLINVFVMTEELSEFLKQWTKNRPLSAKEVRHE